MKLFQVIKKKERWVEAKQRAAGVVSPAHFGCHTIKSVCFLQPWVSRGSCGGSGPCGARSCSVLWPWLQSPPSQIKALCAPSFPYADTSGKAGRAAGMKLFYTNSAAEFLALHVYGGHDRQRHLIIGSSHSLSCLWIICCSFCLGSNFRVLNAFLGLGKWQAMPQRKKMAQQQQGL